MEADELEIEDCDDIREDATALFGINIGDGNVPINVVDVCACDVGGRATAAIGACSTDTHGTSSSGKRKSSVWADFKEVKENDVRVVAICKNCSNKRLSARSCAGTGHFIRHQASCRKKTDHAHRVQSRLALNRDGFHNWVYNPVVAHTELCL